MLIEDSGTLTEDCFVSLNSLVGVGVVLACFSGGLISLVNVLFSFLRLNLGV